MTVQEPPEIRLAQPTVDVRADFDAHRIGHIGGSPNTLREIDLSESTFAEQLLDAVAKARLRADDDLRFLEQLAVPSARSHGSRRPRRCVRWM